MTGQFVGLVVEQPEKQPKVEKPKAAPTNKKPK